MLGHRPWWVTENWRERSESVLRGVRKQVSRGLHEDGTQKDRGTYQRRGVR